MFNMSLTQEGKAFRILGITKHTFIVGPDTQQAMHARKSMFVLNTPNWSKGKHLNPVKKWKS